MRDIGKIAVLAVAPLTLKSPAFSGQQSPLPTLLWVNHRDCGDPLHITGVNGGL